MELTPIKTRGRKINRKVSHPRSNKLSQQRALASPGITKKAKNVKLKKTGLSTLEKLPLEILETIGYMSENVSFRKTSVYMDFRLSSRSYMLNQIILAFGPLWKQWYGIPRKDVVSYFDWARDAERFDGNPDYQSKLLAQEWADWELIVNAMQLWHQRDGKGRVFMAEEISMLLPPVTSVVSSFMDPEVDPERIVLYPNFSLVAYFDQEFGRFVRFHASSHVDLQRWGQSRNRNKIGYINVHPNFVIPDELLTGPFSWKSAKKLYWMIQSGAYLCSETQTWEITLEGFEVCLDMQDHHLACIIIALFLMLGVFRPPHWPEHLIKERLVRMSLQLEIISRRPARSFLNGLGALGSYFETLEGDEQHLSLPPGVRLRP